MASGAAHADLHFVGNEHAPGCTDGMGRAGQVSGRRHDLAAATRYGFRHECGDIRFLSGLSNGVGVGRS